MNKYFFDNYWAMLWLALGLAFFIIAAILSLQGNEKSTTLLALAVTCHGRCETKILAEKIKEYEERNAERR